MTQISKYTILIIALTFFSVCLNGQSRKVNFNYNIGGSTFQGSISLIGVNETATSSENKQQNLKPGSKWNLSCPPDAEYCGLMLGFSNLKLANPNHHAKIYFSDYSKLVALEVDRRSGDFATLSTGNNQAILVFGITSINQNGQIPFRIKISGDGELVSAKSTVNSNEVVFLQNYSITENTVVSGGDSSKPDKPVVKESKPSVNTKPIKEPTKPTNVNSTADQSPVENNKPSEQIAPKPNLSEEELWGKALVENKIVHFTEYIRAFPMGGKVLEARDKIDSLKWNVAYAYGLKDYDANKKISRYQAYLEEAQNKKFKQKACQEIDILQWQEAKKYGTYDKYLEDLIALRKSCSDYVPQHINAEELSLKTNKTCEGKNCSIKFKNHIAPIEASQFDLASEALEITKIENGEVFFKIDNPKSKYIVNYKGTLGRTQSFILGLEDYFSLNFEVDKPNKTIILSDIEGGVPPYFLQVKSNSFFKQMPLGAGPMAMAELNGLKGLPKRDVQFYLTDAEKKIEKHIANVNFGGSFLQSQLFFLLLAIFGFLVIGVLFFIKRRENQRKAAEWEMNT